MSLALHYISWVLFFLSSVLLIAVILLQESKGGGMSEAFGGVGAETFGVKSGGINKVTMTLAAVFCISALVINATWNN
jgi:protein translocase SecG subunit